MLTRKVREVMVCTREGSAVRIVWAVVAIVWGVGRDVGSGGFEVGLGLGFLEVDVGNGKGGSWGGSEMLNGQHRRWGLDICICARIRGEGI